MVMLLSCNSKYNSSQVHVFNSHYAGKSLDQIAFPIGGIDAEMFWVEGTAAISHLTDGNCSEKMRKGWKLFANAEKNMMEQSLTHLMNTNVGTGMHGHWQVAACYRA